MLHLQCTLSAAALLGPACLFLLAMVPVKAAPATAAGATPGIANLTVVGTEVAADNDSIIKGKFFQLDAEQYARASKSTPWAQSTTDVEGAAFARACIAAGRRACNTRTFP